MIGWKLWAGLGWAWTFFDLAVQSAGAFWKVDSRGMAILGFLGRGAAAFGFLAWAVLPYLGKDDPLPGWVRWAPAGVGLTLLVSLAVYLHSGGMC